MFVPSAVKADIDTATDNDNIGTTSPTDVQADHDTTTDVQAERDTTHVQAERDTTDVQADRDTTTDVQAERDTTTHVQADCDTTHVQAERDTTATAAGADVAASSMSSDGSVSDGKDIAERRRPPPVPTVNGIKTEPPPRDVTSEQQGSEQSTQHEVVCR